MDSTVSWLLLPNRHITKEIELFVYKIVEASVVTSILKYKTIQYD